MDFRVQWETRTIKSFIKKCPVITVVNAVKGGNTYAAEWPSQEVQDIVPEEVWLSWVVVNKTKGMIGCIGFPWFAIKKFPNLGCWKRQKFIVSQFWRLKVQKWKCHQGRALLDGSEREPFLASSKFWCLLAILGGPWFADVSLLHACGHLLCVFTSSSLYLSVSVPKLPLFK